MTRVIALAHKGEELSMKGHDARASEKYRLAAEEAETALPGPDSLVSCSLREQQLEALLSHATASVVEPADADDALREALLCLLPSVMAVLERRKAAGTLLPGTCRPEEEAYHKASRRKNLELQDCPQAVIAEKAVYFAPYVGVEAHLRAAVSVVYMLNVTCPFALSEAQIQAALLFVVSALDLMTRPRDVDDWLAGEPDFVRELRKLIPRISDMNKPETKKLCAAWQRLLRSGVLRERGIDEGIDAGHQRTVRLHAAAEADLAAGRLQQCALAGCAARETHVSQFKRCGACRTVSYCCREHQVEDWPSHKAACKAARKAAADPAGASSGT